MRRNKQQELKNGLYVEMSNAINHGLTVADILREIQSICEDAHIHNPNWRWNQDATLIASIIPKISN